MDNVYPANSKVLQSLRIRAFVAPVRGSAAEDAVSGATPRPILNCRSFRSQMPNGSKATNREYLAPTATTNPHVAMVLGPLRLLVSGTYSVLCKCPDFAVSALSFSYTIRGSRFR